MTTPKYLLVLLFSGLILRLWLAPLIYSGDLNNHFAWGRELITQGPLGAYTHFYPGVMAPTYPPVALYFFASSWWLFHLGEQLVWHLNLSIPAFPSALVWWFADQDIPMAFQKLSAILADLGIGTLIFAWVNSATRSRLRATFFSAAYLYNPAVWYLSSLWGQIDSLPILFILASFLSVYLRHPRLAHLTFALALLSKQSSVIYLPILMVG